MSFYDFASGFVNTVKGNMDVKADMDRQLEFFKKQEKIREDMRKKAEDAKVAAKQIIQGDTSQGPAQLQVEEYNPSGRLIGTRLATKGEEEKHVMDKQTRAANLAAATSEAEAKTRKEGREELKLQSQLARDKASTAASYANAESSRAYAKNLASPSVGNEATLWKDINNLLGDPDYQAAVQAGDPSVLREMGASDPVIGGLRAAGKAIGVDVPEDSRPNLLREIEQEQDPAVRAQMLASFKRRLEMAAAKGRSGGKGIRPPRNQE